MFETDDKYRLLGFRIEDLGCCKVICHKEFGRKVFVGTMVTSVPVSNGIIQQIFCELDITNLIAFQSKTGAKSATMDSTEFNLWWNDVNLNNYIIIRYIEFVRCDKLKYKKT